MNGRVGLLSVLLALQLAAIAAVLLTGNGYGRQKSGPLLDFQAAKVTEMRVTGGEVKGDDQSKGKDATLVLSRADATWHLPDGLPADADKVQDVLGKLAGLSAPWPVATTASAAKRFEVTADHFQRHVVLLAGKKTVADLYLGTSPGYQQVHARPAEGSDVYSVGISNYEIPTDADGWLDKALIEPDGKVSAVAREGSWTLAHKDKGWLLGDEAADQKAADDLVRRLSELRVTGVAKPPASGTKPSDVLAVTDDKGTYHLSLYQSGQGKGENKSYVVKSDRRDGWFGLAGYTADKLLAERSALLPDKTAADKPAADQTKAGQTNAGRGKATGETSGAETPTQNAARDQPRPPPSKAPSRQPG